MTQDFIEDFMDASDQEEHDAYIVVINRKTGIYSARSNVDSTRVRPYDGTNKLSVGDLAFGILEALIQEDYEAEDE